MENKKEHLHRLPITADTLLSKQTKKARFIYYIIIGAGIYQPKGGIFIKNIVISNWDKLPAVINLHTAALIFGVADSTIKRWISSGALPAHKVGKLWFFNKSDLMAVMNGGVAS